MTKLHKWEAAFWEAWQTHGLPGNDLEPRMVLDLEIAGEVLPREFDFGSAVCRLFVECDGLGGFDPKARRERCGGHQTVAGMARDGLKHNAAIVARWRVLVFPSSLLNTGPRLLSRSRRLIWQWSQPKSCRNSKTLQASI